MNQADAPTRSGLQTARDIALTTMGVAVILLCAVIAVMLINLYPAIQSASANVEKASASAVVAADNLVAITDELALAVEDIQTVAENVATVSESMASASERLQQVSEQQPAYMTK